MVGPIGTDHLVSHRVLFNEACTGAPYALALWVDKPEPVYQGLRERGMPVARWDMIWQGAPALAGDQGALWRTHVLQLLCHQDMREDEVAHMGSVLLQLLAHAVASPASDRSLGLAAADSTVPGFGGDHE